MAVGLSLDSENIPAFRRKINEFADNFGKMPYDKINIECKLNPAYINLDLIDSLSLMQPYGAEAILACFRFVQYDIEEHYSAFGEQAFKTHSVPQ